MYGLVLLAHSWLRWIVLALAVTLLAAVAGAVRGAEWSGRCERLRRGFLAALDTQMLLGLTLYLVLSPLSRTGWSDLGAALQNPAIRFFTIEHVFGMVVAIAVAHGGLDRIPKLAPELRARRAAIVMAVWIVIALVSIPWPGLPYGRPLARPWP